MSAIDRIREILQPHLDTGDSRTAADWAVAIAVELNALEATTQYQSCTVADSGTCSGWQHTSEEGYNTMLAGLEERERKYRETGKNRLRLRKLVVIEQHRQGEQQ